MPEAEPLFTEDQRPDVLSPNTLHNVTAQAVKGPPPEPIAKVKKGWKRPAKKNQAPPSSSKPTPTTIVQDKIPTNVRSMHVLGKPILPPKVLKTMTGGMVSLHDSILECELELMRQASPSYPLYVAKVPKGLGFVVTPPGEFMFLRFDDLFSMFHLHRLHPTVVRLVTLRMAYQVAKEETPAIAIMDPFYMLKSSMHDGCDRIIVTQYIEDFFAVNKQK
jgi:hypothetical protein